MAVHTVDKTKDLHCYVPTGYTTLDIMLGENIRDLDGNLVTINRGLPIGTHMCISGKSGTGKSTLTMDAISYGIKMGFPCHKIIVLDSDGGVYHDNRIKKLTKLEDTTIFSVYNFNSPNDLEDIMKQENEEYKMNKYKPVKFIDPTTAMEIKMMPYTIVVIDTISSLKSENYDVDAKKSTLAAESSLTTYREISEFVRSCTNYCDGNILFLWVAHLKQNSVAIGAYQPVKDFKSAPADVKMSIPYSVKGKLTVALALEKVIDSVNIEKASDQHILSRLNLSFKETKKAEDDINEYVMDMEAPSPFTSKTNPYSAQGRLWKSRTGPEGRTMTEFCNMNGEFNRLATHLIDCDNLGVFTKSIGMYPSADMPHIFKGVEDAEEERAYMSTFKKQALKMEGYDRPFNLMEAWALLNYQGNDPELRQRQIDFYAQSLIVLQEKLRYELEVNNITHKDIKTFRNFMDLSAAVNQRAVSAMKNIKKEEPKIEATTEEELAYHQRVQEVRRRHLEVSRTSIGNSKLSKVFRENHY